MSPTTAAILTIIMIISWDLIRAEYVVWRLRK